MGARANRNGLAPGYPHGRYGTPALRSGITHSARTRALPAHPAPELSKKQIIFLLCSDFYQK